MGSRNGEANGDILASNASQGEILRTWGAAVLGPYTACMAWATLDELASAEGLDFGVG
jgi:hypothetical protein